MCENILEMSDRHSLADFIKKVHLKLRINSRMLGTRIAWEEHCNNEDLLKRYASAMEQLATLCWDVRSKQSCGISRISWIVKQSQLYFYGKERMKWFERENKLASRYCLPFTPLMDELSKPLRLLDVGSCYNPFILFDMFEVTAIDLAPATKNVMKCDFLSLKIGENLTVSDFRCVELPNDSFDIIVFSLFLDYLPCPEQRFHACLKAYNLLKRGGIFFIVSPDSKHATANSRIMKQWRFTMASLGFLRVNYEKLQHLHCMIFRKCFNENVAKHWLSLQNCESSLLERIIIPQDKHNYTDLGEELKGKSRHEEDNKDIAELFTYLSIDEDIFN